MNSISDVPNATASGPISAYPIGFRATEPSQSNELIRESACSGTHRCSVESQIAPPNAKPTPVTNPVTAITGSGSGTRAT